jgi:hypothetical protein
VRQWEVEDVNDKNVVTSTVDVATRWPHISRYLRVDDATGWIDGNFRGWHSVAVRVRCPDQEYAAASEEWADFYLWRLEQDRVRLADDRGRLRLVEEWTDSVVYIHKRMAARGRGEDPGEWIPQYERRAAR